MKKKFRAPLDIKGTGEGKGEIEAVFASLGGPPDHDNDVTLPGAFGHQKDIYLESWDHGKLPVGIGEVFERDDRAVFKGRFFLNSRSAKDHFETLRELPSVQFSYTFDVVDYERTSFGGRPGRILKKMDVWGVGPVSRAAGLNTALIRLKSADGRSAMSPAAFGRYIDGLLQQHLLDRLDRMEKRVKDLTPPPSRVDVAQQQLVAGGLSPNLAAHIIGAEVEALVNERARLDPFYHQNEVIARQRARTVVMRELNA